MLEKYHRIFAGVVLVLIVIYGVLKIWVLRIYSSILDGLANYLGIGDNQFFEMVRNQAKQEEFREQTLGWVIYYPTYFLLHIVFIFLLFNNNIKTRNYLMIGLTVLISSLVFLWIIFQTTGLLELSLFFRNQFKNLFGLPFILLAIEGGRILYNDLVKLNNSQS